MALQQDDIAARQARLETMIAEFRAAQQRRLVKQGMALWNRTEAAYKNTAIQTEAPPATLNEHLLAGSSDERDLVRMDSDKG
jgi:hypothetical protein